MPAAIADLDISFYSASRVTPMITQLEFHFDIGSPNAYLSHRVIPQIEKRTGYRFKYVPILLGGLFKLTNNESPMAAYKDIPAKKNYALKETERFVARHQLNHFQRNPFFPINTLTIMRACLVAKELNCFEAYVEQVFKCMWEKKLNLADIEVLSNALNEAGLDANVLLEGTQSPHIKTQLIQNTQRSAEMGAFGVPTFFVNNDIYFGKDKLCEIEKLLLDLTDH